MSRIKNFIIDEWALLVWIGAIIALVGLFVWVSAFQANRNQTCLANGYREYSAGYCIRLENGTEKIVSFDDIE